MGERPDVNTYAPPHVLKTKDWTIGLSLMVGTLIVSILFSNIVLVVLPSDVELLASIGASGCGTLLMFALYCYLTDRTWSFVDVPGVSVKAIGVGLGVGVVLAAVQAGLTLLFLSWGVGDPVGQLGRLVQMRGAAFLAAITAINFLLIAPSEELLYRNGIQKLLSRSHTTTFAVAGTSLIFALPHLLNSMTFETVELLTIFVKVFVNGIGYGFAYVYWQRIDVAAVAHGTYNAIVFLFAYFHVFGA